MRTAALIFLSLLFTFTLSAQRKYTGGYGKITGRIIDSATQKPVAFATVALHRTGDQKIINGASANDRGFFTIDSVTYGSYIATFDFIGYTKIMKTGIVVSEDDKKISLGDIRLSESVGQLGTVNVKGRKSVIENQADRIVFNVDKDVTSQGGVATDVLKKIPEVSVDVDGNVEVQGNSSILFLINGKPSTIFGNNITEVLQTIPASEIKKIEVITIPGANYDAEGTGGIINIVLKKSVIHGINGNVSGSLGTRHSNGSVNLNIRNGNIGGHVWFSEGNSILTTNSLNSLNSVTDDTADKKTNTLIQNGQAGFHRIGYQGGAGFDWDINSKNSLSISFGYEQFSHSDFGFTNQHFTQDSAGNTLQNASSVLNNSSSFGGSTLDYSLFYKKLFDKEKQQLTFLYSSSMGNNNSSYLQHQNSTSGDTLYSGTRGNNTGTDNESRISIDYVQPINKNVLIETGAKATINAITSNSGVYVLNTGDGIYNYSPGQSNAFFYHRNVYAGYISGDFTIWNILKVKAGLRYEKTTNSADFGIGKPISIPDYNTLAPSFVASKDIGKNQVVKIGYNHRIERPEYRELNPFINSSDPKNMSTGNPELQPEISDKIEAGYSKSFDRGDNLNISLFYITDIHDVKPYITYYPEFMVGDSIYTNVNLTQRANVGEEQKTGLSISGSVPVTSKFNVRGDIMLFDRHIINQLVPGQNSTGVDYRINLNASYQFDSNLVAEAYCNYRSPITSIQGKTQSWSSYTIAIRKFIWHKRGSIGLTANNPFNEYVDLPATQYGTNFTITSDRKVPFRSFGLSFTYRFGKLDFKKDQGNDESPDDSDGI